MINQDGAATAREIEAALRALSGACV